MILSGDVLDGTTLPVTAGPGGLVIGARMVAPRREPGAGAPPAVVH
jgi:ATP-dependent Clp protease ATP-binding subunit ClpB